MARKFYSVFLELHIGSSIRYENIFFGNYFLKFYIVKRILISFNCFSEYRLNTPFVYKKVKETTAMFLFNI